MCVTRPRSLFLATVSMALSLSGVASFAQVQPDPPSVREYCIKITPGKGAEFEAFLKDVSLPLARARAEAGEFDWFVVASSVAPAGTSAPCDYRVAYGYKGLPPETPSKDALTAALKRAKPTMTFDAMVARRDALRHLVGVEFWTGIDGIGPPVEKDNYIVFNHYNVKYGEMAEWLRLETTYWKPVMDAWLKAGGKGAWSVTSLLMPTGAATPYNAMTIDVFPDWNSMVRGVPVNDVWPKVHPNATFPAFFDRLEKVRSVHDREVYKVVDVVRAK